MSCKNKHFYIFLQRKIKNNNMKTLLLSIVIISLIASCSSEKKEDSKKDAKQTDSVTSQTVACEWNHVINWFEIPVTDFDRAKLFYETILGIEMQTMVDSSDVEAGPYSMGFFRDMNDSTAVSGAIVKSNFCKPNKDGGVTIYLNANPDLSVVLGKIEKAGGKITMPKTPIGENHEHGFMAMFIDTEGNVMALHSAN